MALPKPVTSLFYRIFYGYGRHDEHLFGRFAVPVERTNAEFRSACQGGAR